MTPKTPTAKAVKAWAIVSPKGIIISAGLSDGEVYKKAVAITGFDLIGNNNLLINGYRCIRVLISPL
jgi:hypothetical protein